MAARKGDPARRRMLMTGSEEAAEGTTLDAEPANRNQIRRRSDADARRPTIGDARRRAARRQGDALTPTTPQPGDVQAVGVREVVSRQADGADVKCRLPGPLRVRRSRDAKARENGERQNRTKRCACVLQLPGRSSAMDAACCHRWLEGQRHLPLPAGEDWGGSPSIANPALHQGASPPTRRRGLARRAR